MILHTNILGMNANVKLILILLSIMQFTTNVGNTYN